MVKAIKTAMVETFIPNVLPLGAIVGTVKTDGDNEGTVASTEGELVGFKVVGGSTGGRVVGVMVTCCLWNALVCYK